MTSTSSKPLSLAYHADTHVYDHQHHQQQHIVTDTERWRHPYPCYLKHHSTAISFREMSTRFTFRSCLLEEISFVSSPVHFLSSSFVILCVRPHRNKTTAAILQKTFLDWTNSSITCSNQSTTQQQQTQQKSKNKLTRQTRGRTNRGPCKEP